MPTSEVCALLGTSIENARRLRPAVRWRGIEGRHGYFWHRGDCEEMLRIGRECELTLRQAARVLKAKREGRL